MIYIESIHGYPYMPKQMLAEEFHISKSTVYARMKEIEEEIQQGRKVRPFNPETDEPRTGWDAFMAGLYLQRKYRLYVDADRNIWADNVDVIGRVIET